MCDDDDKLGDDQFVCDTIRSSSSSFVRGPTWSFGVGSNRDATLSTARNNGTNPIDGSRQRSSTSLSESALKLHPTLIIHIPTVYLTKLVLTSPATTTKGSCNNENKIIPESENKLSSDSGNAHKTQPVVTASNRDINSGASSSGVSSSTSSTTSSSSSSNATPSEQEKQQQQQQQQIPKKIGSSYHAYQVSLRASSGETWSIYRRYSQFYAFHSQLKSIDSKIAKRFKIPPKRTLNSKSSTIVQERRIKLEEYLNSIAAYIDRHIPMACLTLNESNNNEQTTTIRSQVTAEIISDQYEQDTSRPSNLPAPSLPIDIPGNETDFGEADFDEDDDEFVDANMHVLSAEARLQKTELSPNEPAGSTQNVQLASSASEIKLQTNPVDESNTNLNPTLNERQETKLIQESSDPQIKVRNLFYEFISFQSKMNEPIPEMAHSH